MKRLVLAPKARADLFDIDAYIAERNPLAAERLIERLIQAMKTLVRMPLDGGVSVEATKPARRGGFGLGDCAETDGASRLPSRRDGSSFMAMRSRLCGRHIASVP